MEVSMNSRVASFWTNFAMFATFITLLLLLNP
jgi:hypothetical protein